MMRRSAHLRIGLDDPDMVRAPDYELWTRALRLGCHFLVVPEKLTCVRVHSRGVTHGDPTGATIEKAWVALRNLRPHAERLSAWPSFEKIIAAAAHDAALAGLQAAQRYRLFAALCLDVQFECFGQFRHFLDVEDHEKEMIGRRLLALALGRDGAKDRMIEKLYSDIGLYIEARDYWQRKAQGEPLKLQNLRGTRISPDTAAGSLVRQGKWIAKRLLKAFRRDQP
jgi:hypothetical protein